MQNVLQAESTKPLISWERIATATVTIGTDDRETLSNEECFSPETMMKLIWAAALRWLE
jgi:hypothetical protein